MERHIDDTIPGERVTAMRHHLATWTSRIESDAPNHIYNSILCRRINNEREEEKKERIRKNEIEIIHYLCRACVHA